MIMPKSAHNGSNPVLEGVMRARFSILQVGNTLNWLGSGLPIPH